MENNTYTENDIKTLSEIEHVRQNADMYIGVTDTPTHLLYEVLDNALDEANAGHATLIMVSVDTKTNTYMVADNGRGIPFKNNKIVDIATKLFTGGKFEKGENAKAYKTAIGLHGIGLLAVTALSDWVEITVFRDGKKVYYRFEDCKVVDHKEIDFDMTKKPCSTCIKFKPSEKYFESLKVNINAVKVRMELASIHIDKLTMVFAEDGKSTPIKMSMNGFFQHNYYGDTNASNHTPIFTYEEKIKDEKLRIDFGWDMNTYSTCMSGGCVNLLPVNQGTHINRTMILFQDVFENIAKKEKLSYNSMDFKTGFRVYTTLELYVTKYDSQTKQKLSNRRNEIEHLYSKAEKKIEDILRSDNELFNKIVYYIDSYRKSLTVKKNVIKSTGPVTRYNQDLDSKLKDCTSVDVDKCELFITEGDSASGGLVQCRDVRYHAIMGMRGKIQNLASKNVDYLKNKELVGIINAIGTGCGKDFDINGRKYGKIIFATDADLDGDHIKVLLIVAFLRMFRELVEAGLVYLAILPLYGVKNFNGKFIPLYTEEDMLKFRNEHPDVEITRYKGLGEMMPNQLKEVLLNPNVRRLVQIKCDDDIEPIFKLLSDAESKRNLILGGENNG
jgi:DNA gyrase/topoisomerase IV subunit B